MTATIERGPNDLVHTYEPRGTAQQLMEDRADEVLISGPAGTGKSRACLEKMLLCALLNPEFVGLIARKTGVSLTGTTLDTWRKFVAKEAIRAGLCVYYGGSREEPAQYRFSNGARILLTGMNDPTKIMSAEFDMVYVGEATELTPTDWEFFTTRLRNGGMSFQQIIADCNPGPPQHWLKKRAESGVLKILYSAHWENPRYYRDLGPRALLPSSMVLDPSEIVEHGGRVYRLTPTGVSYIGKLRNLTGVRRLRLYAGVWAAADGLVYDNWDPQIHHVPKFVPPQEWPRYWAVDFGFRNPFVCQFWAEDPDGRLWLYREIYATGRLVEDHARAILRTCTRGKRGLNEAQKKIMRDDRAEALKLGLVEWSEPQPQAIVCDHDAEGRATLEKYLGRGTTAAVKTVKPGIEGVEARLKVAGDGKPRLLIMQNCTVAVDSKLDDAGLPTGTADEMGSYVWAPQKPGQAPKEEVLKENDHGMDAKRYIVAHRDLRLRIRDRDHVLEG